MDYFEPHKISWMQSPLCMVLCKCLRGIPEIYNKTKQNKRYTILPHPVVLCLFKEASLHVSQFDVPAIALKYLSNGWMEAFGISSQLSMVMELK